MWKWSGKNILILNCLCFLICMLLSFLDKILWGHMKVWNLVERAPHFPNVCGLTTFSILPPWLFANLAVNCKLIAVKSRKYSKQDWEFIATQVNKLLSKGITELSMFPWWALVIVTTNEQHKKRMAVDYSQLTDSPHRMTILYLKSKNW